MIRELRKMRKKGGKDRALANYISVLQRDGKIGAYFSADGYVGYDTEELKEYKAKVRIGRPSKYAK